METRRAEAKREGRRIEPSVLVSLASTIVTAQTALMLRSGNRRSALSPFCQIIHLQQWTGFGEGWLRWPWASWSRQSN